MPNEDPKTNMDRYYYRPGTTEPELRPEFAAEEEAKAAADTGPVGPSGGKKRAPRKAKAASAAPKAAAKKR